ncbi:MAG: flagellin [Paracoccaceae bacterium]
MTSITIGDLANTFLIKRQTSGLKSEMARLASELTTGQKADLGASLAGDFGPFAGIERSLRAIAAYTTANSEAAGMLTASQLALENVQSIGRDLSTALLTASSSEDVVLIGATAEDARQKFSAVVSTLNTSMADRTLFGGAATDRPALATGEEMLAEIAAATAGETTAAGIVAAVEAWFDDAGGGFETMGYLGSTSDMGPMLIAEDETVSVGVRADGQVIRDTLKGYALMSLIAGGALAGQVTEQADLAAAAATQLLAADGDITDVRARIGAVEARIEDAQARNAAEKSAYELARTELVGADPYQTATELQAVYAQIETLYTVTARIAGLKFTDYMR